MTLKYVSVCSGIESASVAWEPLGFEALAFSEIEPFPCAVLAHHWPNVPNLGDFTKIPGFMFKGVADLLVGGTPCQPFSLAGKRESLADDRGNLHLEFCRLANEMEVPTVVWENVPGILTTDDNAFGCFIAKLCGNDLPALPSNPLTEDEINGTRIKGPKRDSWRWSKSANNFVPKWPTSGYAVGPKRRLAWRVLDAQFFGVAQRRRRVFVVASTADGADPATVLFEPESLRRDSPPSRETGQEVANCVAAGVGDPDRDANAGRLVRAPRWPADIACTLNASFGAKQGLEDQHINGGDKQRSPAVCIHQNSRSELRETEISCALSAGGGKPGQGYAAARVGGLVRKLTPVECERLQGFPDGHTLLPYGVKQKVDRDMIAYYSRHFCRPITEDEARALCSDGPRYKAVGNSKAVPVVRWLGQRIKEVLKCK